MIYIRRDDAILLCCITNNYFFSIQVGLDIFVRFNRDVEPMWACYIHEYYTDFKSRVQNVNIKRGRNFFPNNTWDGCFIIRVRNIFLKNKYHADW